MAQVTVEGSALLKSTFLAPGARITVERTKYIENLIRRGFVNVVANHEPIHEPARETSFVEPDTSFVKTEDDPDADDQLTVAGAAFGAPPSSALKSIWAEFLTANGVDYPAGSTKLEMIRLWNASEAAYGKPVD